MLTGKKSLVSDNKKLAFASETITNYIKESKNTFDYKKKYTRKLKNMAFKPTTYQQTTQRSIICCY